MRTTKHRKRKQRRHFLPRKILRILAILLLIGGGLWLLNNRGIIDWPNQAADEPTAETEINLDPPTEEEQAQADIVKGEDDTPTETSPTTTNNKTAVTPVISAWGYNSSTGNAEIGGFVPGVLENGGTCTATLTKSGQTVTESKTGEINVQNTSCGIISIASNRLSSGTWKATLSYSSTTAEGTSTSRDLEMP